jgi:hypothetical protein
MYKEAVSIKNLFVDHKDDDYIQGISHKGWKSLTIHGIDEKKTRHYKYYGFTTEKDAKYTWTTIASKCPITFNWLKNIFPLIDYNRIRFMLLEPGGYIIPHKDGYHHELAKINIALNHPENCVFKMEHHGVVPMKPGVVMFLDVFNLHSYINKSKEDRIHIIIHPGNPNTEFKKLVENSYKKRVSFGKI